MHEKILLLQRQIPTFLWIGINSGNCCAAAVKHEKLSTNVAAQEQSMNGKEGQTSGPKFVRFPQNEQPEAEPEEEQEWWKMHRQWRNSPNTWQRQHRKEFKGDLDAIERHYLSGDHPSSRSSQHQSMPQRPWQQRQTDSGQEWWKPASPLSGDPNALPTQEELYLQHQQHLSRDGRRFGTPREALYAQEQVAIGLQQKFGRINYERQQMQGRLRDPQKELRKIRRDLLQMCFEEYTENRGSAQSLRNVLEWADQMRRNGVESQPLLLLIDRLKNEFHGRIREALIQPVFKSFLQTDEAKPFADRPELLFPLIAQAFHSTNTVEQLRSLCPQIKASLEHFNSPERIERLGDFLKWQFLGYFIYTKSGFQQNSRQKMANAVQIEEMAAALRSSGCYPAPLVDAIQSMQILHFQTRKHQSEPRIEHLYQAFLAEPEERKLFTNRPHIFFPWILRNLANMQKGNKKLTLKIMDELLQMHADPAQARNLPDFMVTKIRENLPLVTYAAKHGHFGFVQRVMDCSPQLKYHFVWHPRVLLQFALHNWLNGNLEKAQTVKLMLFRTRDKFLRTQSDRRRSKTYGFYNPVHDPMMRNMTMDDVERQLGHYHHIHNALDTTNQCFRELMTNPCLTRKEREKYSRIFLGYVRDVVYRNGMPKS